MELGQVSGSSQKGFRPGLDVRLYEEDDLDRLDQVRCPRPCRHCSEALHAVTEEGCYLPRPENKNSTTSWIAAGCHPLPSISAAPGVLYCWCWFETLTWKCRNRETEARNHSCPCCIHCCVHAVCLDCHSVVCTFEIVQMSVSYCGLFLADGRFRRDGETDWCVFWRHQQSHGECVQWVANVILKAPKATNSYLPVGGMRCWARDSV